MRTRFRLYAATAAAMLVLDLLWLGVISPPLYRATIGPLLRPAPDLLAASLFYLIYVVGVAEFAVRPDGPAAPAARRLARGALFGLVAYATFDLTAMAVLTGWSWTITVIDMAWGTALTAVVATAAGRWGFGRPAA